MRAWRRYIYARYICSVACVYSYCAQAARKGVRAVFMVAYGVACALAVPGVLNVARADDASFRQMLEAAYLNHPQIQSQRQALKALDERVSQALSGWRPQIQLDYERGRKRNRFSGGPWSYVQADVRQLVIEQPLFRGGGTVASTRGAEQRVYAGRAQLLDVEQRVLSDAIAAYLGVVRTRAIVELNDANVTILGEHLRNAQLRFRVGEATRTDVAQAQARLASARSAARRAQGEFTAARATFVRMAGYDPAQVLAFPHTTPALPATLEEALRIAQIHSPQLHSAKHAMHAAEHDVDTQVAQILPSVSLRGSMRREEGVGFFGANEADNDALTVNVTVPIYQAGAEYARVRESKAVWQQQKFVLIDAQHAVREEVARAWEGYLTSQTVITSYEAAIEAAHVALEGVKKEHEFGTRTQLDVLDAEQELLEARINLIGAQHDRWLALYGLLRTMGRLTMDVLGLDIASYAPDTHYKDVKYKMIGF